MPKRRVAILGAGIGRSHLDGYLALTDLYDVRVICDANLDRARTLAARSPHAATTELIDDAIDRDDVDLIDVCLPPHLHAEVAEKALHAGKDVVCEKPVCSSLVEFDRLAAQAEATERSLLPVFQYRYGVGLQKLSHLINANVTGKQLVASLETHWNRRAAYYDNPWRGRRAYELGGAVLSHAIHMHDLLTWMLGPVRRVFARTAVRVNDIETEDCASINLEMESGALVTHSITLGGADELSRIRVCFTDMTAENDGHAPYDPGAEPWQFRARPEGTQPQVDMALRDFSPGPTGFTGLLTHIYTALGSKGEAAVMQETGRQSIELASAIYHSAATGEDVRLPMVQEHPAYAGWNATHSEP